MTDKILNIFPNLVRYAESKEQYDMFESLESCIQKIDIFIKSNKVADFEDAIDYLNYTLSVVSILSERDRISNQDVIDKIHDVLFLPMMILEHTAIKNETIKNLNL